MRHAPYGYRIENGRAVIEESEATQIRALFRAYLDGDSLAAAAKKSGIVGFHAGIGRMLQHKRYLGDGFYPAIIDPETFAAAEAERVKRAETLGRVRATKEASERAHPATFTIAEGKRQFDDPFQQAEYVYSLIKTEE